MEDRYKGLKLAAEMYWDCQEFRKAMENKARSGQVDDEFVSFASAEYKKIEAKASRSMKRNLRMAAPGPVLAWIWGSPGVGEHLAAKLLGVIGDPYIAYPMHFEDRPGAKGGKDDPKRVLVEDEPYIRNVAKLWAYCGVGDPARKRRSGMTAGDAAALGQWKAKTTLRLLAESCVKQPGSRYEIIYRQARQEYEGRVHASKCAQCKGSSEPGQPWRPGHQHAAALRKVAKEILRDLWEAAREAHQDTRPGQAGSGTHDHLARPGHTSPDTQRSAARPDQHEPDAQVECARPGQMRSDAQTLCARPGHPRPETHSVSARPGQASSDTQAPPARPGAVPADEGMSA